METEGNKRNDKNNGGAAGGGKPDAAPPQPKEPTAGEIAQAVSKLVSELESWPAGAQQRVLAATATALGINRQPSGGGQRQQQGRGGNR